MDPITKLFSYLNKEKSSSTYYVLTKYVLNNIKLLPTLSISDFASKNFVSKATITRFVHFLGFDDYLSFKNYSYQMENNSKLSFLKMNNEEIKLIQDNPETYLEQYSNQIIDSIKDARESIKIDEMDKLISNVMAAKKVAFLGYSDSQIIAKDIQLALLIVGKDVVVAESSTKLKDILDSFDENDLIVILSNYGTFFKIYSSFYEQLLASPIPLTLITQNYTSMDLFRFKQTIYLTSKRQLSVGNYPMRLFSEVFVRRAMFNFSNEKL